MDNTLAVTRFKADNVHLNVEAIGSIENQVTRPASVFANQIRNQIRPNADILPIHNVCDRVAQTLNIGNNGRVQGLMDAVNGDITDNANFVRNQINGVRSFGNDFTRAGMRGCNFQAINPPSVLDNLRSSVFGQARNLAGLRFNLDSLLIGEQLRNFLVRSINGICGTNLSGDGLWSNILGLLGILDNMSLFSNSDLLAAIGRCAFFQSEHTSVLNARTSNLAVQGNSRAISDILTNIPDTRIMTDDVHVLAHTVTDSESAAQDLLNILQNTERSPAVLVANAIIIDNEVVNIPSINKVGNFSSKPILTKKLIEESNLTVNRNSTSLLNPDVINRNADLFTPIQIVKNEKGKTVTQSSDKEKLILKNNTKKMFAVIDEIQNSRIQNDFSLNRNSNVNTGLDLPSIDFSSIENPKPRISIKSNPSSTWSNSSVESYSTPSLKSFESLDEDTKLKLDNCSLAMVVSEEEQKLVERINILKKEAGLTDKKINALQTFGSKIPMLRTGCIVGWKKVIQDNGHEVRYAVY